MRILIFLLLGLFVLVSTFYGAQLLWHAFFPQPADSIAAQQPSPAKRWFRQKASRLLFLFLGTLFLLMVTVRLLTVGEFSSKPVAPPRINGKDLPVINKYY